MEYRVRCVEESDEFSFGPIEFAFSSHIRVHRARRELNI